MKQAILILTYLVLAADAQSCSYSSVCDDHTMCKYQGYGSNCSNPIFSGVTNGTDKEKIVDTHNNLRRKVAKGQESRGNPGPQPPAANMRQLSWDDELATVAQRWADQCTFGHDSCRRVSRFYVGQNSYALSTKGGTPNGNQDWQSTVEAWYNNVPRFNNNNVDPFQFIYNAGHYTQVVWAKTYKIGCGFTAYNGSDGWYNKYYVCNYGPGGNVKGASMYKIGNAGTQCPADALNADDGLCV